MSINKRIARLIGLIGPGLFLIGYNIGTGSITTMAQVGAQFGMTLLWTLVLACIFTYVLMVAYGQVTIVSGKTALYNIKNHIRYGRYLALYIMVALIIGEVMALMGIMGITVDLLQEGARLMDGRFVVSTVSLTVILVLTLFALLYFGKYGSFEKLLTVMVLLMALSFIIVLIMIKPNIINILKGLIPSVPKEPGSFELIAAIVGTTCSAAVFIIRSIVVNAKKWSMENLKTEKRDAFVSALMMLLLSGCIMAVAAGTLGVVGKDLGNTLDLVSLFEPIGGKVASFILIFGITSAAISTIMPIILIAPWLITDYMDRPKDIKSPIFRTLGGFGLVLGLGAQFIDMRPPALLIFSQAFQALILPAVALPILILINNRSIMGVHKASGGINLGICLVLMFGLATALMALIEILDI
ncbi:Nramp family divalent metal transporter [Flagellimonas algicola]|uniref:Divalent metal cation transporter n=1 Tax=Flagellimonas algicola TaxID=2583815 RepID=A0ABY2WH10_9FLAO|nr:Nramp family divalent metal transporter [Allomuricauda algicola]TMU50729.1 divalent metal cation transporter [Allomuricauda algicola]